MKERIINIEQVVKMLNLSKATLRRLELQEEFPRKIKLSTRRVGWYESDILAWLHSKKTGDFK